MVMFWSGPTSCSLDCVLEQGLFENGHTPHKGPRKDRYLEAVSTFTGILASTLCKEADFQGSQTLVGG